MGIELTKEGVMDSFFDLDFFENVTVWVIVIVMALSGLTEGLAIGVLSACITFVVQSGRELSPIRGSMSAVSTISFILRVSSHETF